MDAAKKDPDVDAITIVDVETVVEMTVDADFPTGVTVPVDATFSGSSFFFVHVAVTASAAAMAADADFPTGEMAPADATFCGSLFFFAHAAETVSDATTDAATEMVTAAGSSLSFCSFAAA